MSLITMNPVRTQKIIVSYIDVEYTTGFQSLFVKRRESGF